MERTFCLFAICLSLVFSVVAQDPRIPADVINYFRPNVTFGSGQVTCEGAPYAGITITLTCTDELGRTLKLKAASDKNGFYSHVYFTDFPQVPTADFEPENATCTITLVEPAKIEIDCCELDPAVASSKAEKGKEVAFVSPANCVKKPRPSNPEPTAPLTPECPLAGAPQTVYPDVVVYTIQENSIFPDPSASASFSACSRECRREPRCDLFSFNYCGNTCTLYPRGAIALNEALLNRDGYEPAIGPFICPTLIATCNRTAIR